MKALTVGRMAAARLRTNRKTYVSLIVGIFLSVFLVSTLVLCIQGVVLGQLEQTDKRMGYEDALLLDTPELTDGELAETGFFDTIGHVYVSAGVKDTDIYLGWYDDAGASLLRRQLLEGRMPEQAGEIAMERSAMLAIREDGQWQLGDQVTLNLTPIDGVEEERTFTLVGVLAEQSSFLAISQRNAPTFVSGFPAILVSPEEPAFLSGRTVLHRLMTLKVPITEELFEAMQTRIAGCAMGYGQFRVKTMTGRLLDNYFAPDVLGLNSDAMVIAIMAGMLILSLLLSCCVGIAGSMEGILNKRREEIGVLRALGATKGQIRRMFGRESWLLALTTAPISIGLSCLLVWGLEKWAPENMIFKFDLRLMLPIFLLSAATVLLSGSIPLRRASNQMPMSVLRDTELLRKSRLLRSQKQFSVPNLISRRMVRLYPTRLLGGVILSGLMCFCAALFAIVAYEGTYTFMPSNSAYDIAIDSRSFRSFISLQSGRGLSDQSLNQMASLPHVRKVDVGRNLRVNLLLENKTGYFDLGYMINYHMMSEEDCMECYRRMGTEIDAEDEEGYRQSYNDEQQAYSALRKAQNISQEVVYTELQTLSVEELRELEPYLGSGRIDVDAINAGREVLILAPKVYFIPYKDEAGGWYTADASRAQRDMASLSVENDWAYAGQTLPIMQLYTEDAREYVGVAERLFANCTRLDATVTVGGVLDKQPDYLNGLWGSVLTTEQGLRNMNLNRNGYVGIQIFLDGEVDQTVEEELTRSINAIARRAEGSRVVNNMETAREDARSYFQLFVLIGAIALVFFAVSAGMILSTVTRQIQADGKRIGMLRAVGAEEKTILRCYSGQVFLSLALGMALAILVFLLLKVFAGMNLGLVYCLCGIAAILIFSGSCLGLCILLLRRRVRQVTNQSIIENIREL